MKIEYPKFLFHASSAPRIVADPVAHQALGAGWFESPTEADDAASAPAKPAKGDKAGK